MDIDTLLKQAAELLDLTDDGWNRSIYFDVSKLMEECGEAAECLNKTRKTDDDLADELSDIMIVVAVIALKKNIDLDKALVSKQEKRIKKLLRRRSLRHSGKTPALKDRADSK